MRGVVVCVIAAAAIVLAIAVLGSVGPFIAGAGLLLAALVVVNPGGVGARLRQSIAWWSIPAMRRASAGALPFAALVLLYTVPVPMGAYALVHAVRHGSAPSPSNPPQAAVGGGYATTTVPASAPAAPSPTLTPTVAPTAPPTASPTTAQPATAPPPTAPPPRDLCGAPPNPWNYSFCGGGTINSPPSNFCDYFNCISSFWTSTKGYVEECNDGKYSHSGGRKGSCSSHGGDQRPLNG